MKINHLIKGTIWEVTDDITTDKWISNNLKFNRISITIPKGTVMKLEYSRTSDGYAPVKIMSIPEGSELQQTLDNAESRRYRGSTKRYCKADMLISFSSIKDSITLLTSLGADSEFYIREKKSGLFMSYGAQPKMVSIEDAKLFVVALSAMKQICFDPRFDVEEYEIVEYNPFEDMFSVYEMCEDWVYSVRKLSELFLNNSSVVSNALPLVGASNYRNNFQPHTGRIAGVAVVVSNDRPQALLRSIRDSINYHSAHGNIIGMSEPEDLMLIKVALGDKVQIHSFEDL